MSDMNFWVTSDGTDVTKNEPVYNTQDGGGYRVIPDKSTVGAIIDGAEWVDEDGVSYIKITYNCLIPKEVEGVKIRQKLWIKELDPKSTKENAEKRRNKARQELFAIDQLFGSNHAKTQISPTDESLVRFWVGRKAVVSVATRRFKEGENKVSWVSNVNPKGTEIKLTGPVEIQEKTQPVPQAINNSWDQPSDDWGSEKSTTSSTWDNEVDDDVPF